MSLVVAFDESMRRQRYIGVAAVYDVSNARHVTRLVRGHRQPARSPFHAGDESDARKLAFLQSVAACGLVRAWIYEAPFPAATARQTIIAALAADAVCFGAERIILDQINPVQDRQDRLTLARTLRSALMEVPYEHATFGSHPGLEIADAVAWTYGAAGRWTAEVRPLTEFVRLLAPKKARNPAPRSSGREPGSLLPSSVGSTKTR